MSKKTKWVIILMCESEEDQKGLIKSLSKYSTIAWDNDTRESSIKRNGNTVEFNISKSKKKIPPKGLRLK